LLKFGNDGLANQKTTQSIPSSASASSKAITLFSGQQYALTSQKKSLITMPKPQWHAPWKLYRVISGHLGWVRCIDVDPSNEWFATGAGDRIIKVNIRFFKK
jgi:pleiotropic regulator 1